MLSLPSNVLTRLIAKRFVWVSSVGLARAEWLKST